MKGMEHWDPLRVKSYPPFRLIAAYMITVYLLFFDVLP